VTCIVGVRAKGRLYLGADSAIVEKRGITLSSDPKAWRSGGALIGFAGDWLAGDLFRRIDFPSAIEEAWLRRGFPAQWRKLRSEIAGDSKIDYALLIAALGAFWYFEEDTIIGVAGDFAAVGSGQDVARGALHATPKKPPVARALAALEAAAALTPSVRGPFTLLAL
jgi:ATP-dependent protease HslVU (ClpYQ) peptidase subunit